MEADWEASDDIYEDRNEDVKAVRNAENANIASMCEVRVSKKLLCNKNKSDTIFRSISISAYAYP